jgi:hypothetical protein
VIFVVVGVCVDGWWHVLAWRVGQVARYDPEKLQNGPNTLPDGERLYFIQAPAQGLWAFKGRFFGKTRAKASVTRRVHAQNRESAGFASRSGEWRGFQGGEAAGREGSTRGRCKAAQGRVCTVLRREVRRLDQTGRKVSQGASYALGVSYNRIEG